MTHKDIEKVLVTREEIATAVKKLGQEITADYGDKEIVVIGILRGAAVFMTDIIREIDLYMDIDFMSVSSYGDGTESTGQVKIIKDLDTNVRDKHILIVEDIIDTGRTLKHLVELFEYRQAASIKIATLLDKPERRIMKDIMPDYVGIEIPNEFVVGYGLDFQQKYRNLPYIGVLKPEVYQ
ncbi:hypoxanthine phosphoribosyltransferase [Aerococcaceae bacterium DSM 111022]|nr:hypoxanthine phosphoribosyltransferase [Aerococcaceae bacterium DSM 111022]